MDLDNFIKSTAGKAYTKRAILWFKENLGKPVTSEQLAVIPGKDGKPISHNIRRIFELRDEQGYEIVNHSDNDRTGLKLKVDEWVLLAPEPSEQRVRSRGVNKRLMFEVFERDGYTCRICGRTKTDDDIFAPGRKIRLHVGHIKAHKRQNGRDIYDVEGIDNLKEAHTLTEDDFITMCNVCNEGAKNKDIELLSPADLVKKFSIEEKKKAFNYLKEELDKSKK